MEQLKALWARGQAWYQTHTERDRRIILGVVGAVVLSLIYVGVVEPISEYRKGVAESIEETQSELERDSRFLGQAEGLRSERAALKKRLAEAKRRLLPGTSGTLGAAALQERANAIAKEKGVTVQSTQVMRETEVDPFRKVAVRLTLAGDLEPLAQMISGLEHGSQLSIPFLEMSRRGALPNQPNAPRRLSATMEVNGFVASSAEGRPEEGDEPPAETEAAKAEAGEATPAAAPGEGVVPPAGVPGVPTPGAPAGAPGAPLPGLPPPGAADLGEPGAPAPGPAAPGATPGAPPPGAAGAKPGAPGTPPAAKPGMAPGAKPGTPPSGAAQPGAKPGAPGAVPPGAKPGTPLPAAQSGAQPASPPPSAQPGAVPPGGPAAAGQPAAPSPGAAGVVGQPATPTPAAPGAVGQPARPPQASGGGGRPLAGANRPAPGAARPGAAKPGARPPLRVQPPVPAPGGPGTQPGTAPPVAVPPVPPERGRGAPPPPDVEGEPQARSPYGPQAVVVARTDGGM